MTQLQKQKLRAEITHYKTNTYLKDRNGKSVYTGDIVKYRPYIDKEYTGKVVFNETSSSYVLVDDAGEIVALLSEHADFEVKQRVGI